MLGVKYTAGATEQGQQAEFVHERDRPEFSAVEKLILAYDDLAVSTGIPWLAERALVGAHGGLRPGERDALRIRDLRPDKLIVIVDEAFTWPRRAGGPRSKAPKNNKRRQVLLPASTMDRLVRLAERRQAAGALSDALLFEDPRRSWLPLSESTTARLHTAAAIMAGWETVEVRHVTQSQSGLVPERRPRHTNYSLRHHAAVWMHDVAGFDWTDVSRTLGHHSVAFTYAVYVRPGADADERNRGRLASL
jgi:integrase